MRLAYILNQRFPTEKAYGHQVTKMVEAFRRAGAEVALFVPTRQNTTGRDPFSLHRVASPDFYWPGLLDRVAFSIKNFIAARRLVRAARAWKPEVIYTRDPSVAPFADVVEAHKPMRPYPRMIAISQTLKSELVRRGARSENILVAHDGVDLSDFEVAATKRTQFTAMYAGSLFPWKGVEVLKAAAKKLPDIVCEIISGKQPAEIPALLKSADVLVLPQLDSPESQSPLKMFEYMAAQKPIIASDIPQLREVLNERNAFLVPPGDAEALARVISYVREHTNEAQGRAAQAYRDVQEYTWDKRAQKILAFIKK